MSAALVAAFGVLVAAAGIVVGLWPKRRPTPPPAPPATPVAPQRTVRSQTVYVVTTKPEPFDADATAVLRPYRGGRHAAR